MNTPYNYIESNQYAEHSNKWLKWLKYNESIVITFPYLNDRPLRIQQFVETLSSSTNFNPIIFDPTNQIIDEQKDLEKYIDKEKIENKVTVLLVINGDNLFLPQNIKFLEYLQIYRSQHISTFTTIIAFESNLQTKLANFHPYDMLFQNHDYYPLYTDQDVHTFIKFFSMKWDIIIPSKIEQLISQTSCGSFWLAKEAIRIYRDTNTFDPKNPNFIARAASIASALNTEEQTILINAPKITKYFQTQDYNHLKSVGLIDDNNQCRIPALLEPIKSIYNKQHILRTSGNVILLDKLNITIMLSKNENAILLGLMDKPNTPFTRDQVAELIWKENAEDRYSAWAIDQAVKRLRDKLVKIGLPPSTIKSIRGIGYEYRD